jgi:hypothetical protein
MTTAELHTAAARLVGQRVEQGLGERVDRATLARIAALIGEIAPTTTKTPSGRPSVFISEDGNVSAPSTAV